MSVRKQEHCPVLLCLLLLPLLLPLLFSVLLFLLVGLVQSLPLILLPFRLLRRLKVDDQTLQVAWRCAVLKEDAALEILDDAL